MKMLQHFWNDDAGFVVSAELALVATILVLGVMVGLSALRNGVVNELADVSAAIDSVNQSYQLSGTSGHAASTASTTFADARDFCDEGDPNGDTAACIDQMAATPPEGGSGDGSGGSSGGGSPTPIGPGSPGVDPNR